MQNTYSWTFQDVGETQRFAERLAALLVPGDFLALEGDLGAGKTTFTQGLARGLQIDEVVNSPTFTIVKEYHGRLPLYHIDVYRVSDDPDSLDLDPYFFGDGVCVVEWASLIERWLPGERLTITLRHEGEQKRHCELTAQGDRYETLCKELDGSAHLGD
ncbi:tRNA (adenosine(37)-N6)-threonylcarbamoyltransferase complex ATPase subunit type 1 TsaE [Brevibacillus humidisoli]|uniref:tRNA (adenosine(37)-N6)-threonylcarbamoyltransferase complex ATPase subunit type 1 TsaE n=1 Tax=Brevibacillus humidisoli TaxID=2895522 RepID=UPI001E642781|nr:tRNA (adenosine(37)-N6)-threonylcarbamoyltransferase complex ATPase subunit type 1 TsaE [Brevibacillus humidisoli]UFJ40957.1 tRNA (adenosine(37)-N6)-threonylcarbamoyltransferase complex ATPase subunit type 1 TsaE [Brevibacillus humidisoli]